MSVVDRQRVLEILCEECAYRCKTEEVKLKCCFNYHAIATLPCADVKPVVRGEWVITDRYDTQVEKALAMLNDLYSQYNSEISYEEYSQLHDAISSICEAERMEWIIVSKHSDYRTIRCPKCNDVFNIDYIRWFNFCPNCGADMRERSEEE